MNSLWHSLHGPLHPLSVRIGTEGSASCLETVWRQDIKMILQQQSQHFCLLSSNIFSVFLHYCLDIAVICVLLDSVVFQQSHWDRLFMVLCAAKGTFQVETSETCQQQKPLSCKTRQDQATIHILVKSLATKSWSHTYCFHTTPPAATEWTHTQRALPSSSEVSPFSDVDSQKGWSENVCGTEV